jgi:hypothetical protein
LVRSYASLLALGALGLSLISPASSSAVITLGSDLSHNPNESWGCGGMACTASQVTLPGRTVTSPVNGRVITWRIGGGSSGPPVNAQLRIIKPLGLTDLFRSSSAAVSVPSGFGIYTFSTSLAISIGDRIGVNDDHDQGGNLGAYSGSSGGFDVFQPPPLNGATVAPTTVASTGDGELLLNADVVPNGVFARPKKPKPKPDGTVIVTVPLPNPGFLRIGGSATTSGAHSAAAKALVKPLTMTVSAPGDIILRLKPTKATLKRLRKSGNAKGKVTITFTPTGGTPTSQTVKVKLHFG